MTHSLGQKRQVTAATCRFLLLGEVCSLCGSCSVGTLTGEIPAWQDGSSLRRLPCLFEFGALAQLPSECGNVLRQQPGHTNQEQAT